MRPIRRKQSSRVTTDPLTGQDRLLGWTREENVLSDEGSIDTAEVERTFFLDCGCDAKPAGAVLRVRRDQLQGMPWPAARSAASRSGIGAQPFRGRWRTGAGASLWRLRGPTCPEGIPFPDRPAGPVRTFSSGRRRTMADTFSQLTRDVLYCHHKDLLDDDLGAAIKAELQHGCLR